MLFSIGEETSRCNSEAEAEYGMSSQEILEMHLDNFISKEEYIFKLEELHEIYRRKLCELSSQTIEYIIKEYNRYSHKTSSKTIDTLALELLERQLSDKENKHS